jgi:hypothetical protein
MAMDPDFFTRRARGGITFDGIPGLARVALLAAVEAATAGSPARDAAADEALRALRDLCFEVPPKRLVGLRFPLDREAMLASLEQPLLEWLPLADELGVGAERLTLIGLPTQACRHIRARFA